jgi:chaperonin GroEL (HSP60 family)
MLLLLLHRDRTDVHQGSTDLEHIQIIKKVGGKLTDSYLDEGMLWTSYLSGAY